jgi:uncharacterized protein
LTSKHVMFACGNIQLEGELQIPDGEGTFPAVVVCHPHPLSGGDMNSNVVLAICSALVKISIASLRFNFRGVGNSGGSYADGLGEKDDVKAALDFLSTIEKVDSKRIGLAGYSFGGLVAASVAIEDKRIKQLALISPALNEMGWVQIKSYSLPKLILVGDADTVVSFRPFRRFFGDVTQYQIVAGADHFWWDFEEEMSGRIARFFHDGFQGK